MSFKGFIILMVIATIIAWFSWVVVLFLVNPFQADFLNLSFFYISLFFALLGTFSITGSLLRKKFIKKRALFRQVIISFRQAVMFSALIIISLFLQSERILTWWNILVLIGVLTVIELLAISQKTNNSFLIN